MLSILCLTLERRLDKIGAFIGASYLMGVPENLLRFCYGYDGLNYSTADDLLEDLVSDMPFLKWQPYGDNALGTYCYIASYVKCLQVISTEYSESDRVALMFDHTFLNVPWDDFSETVIAVGDFDIFQFHRIWHDGQVELPPSHVEGVGKGLLNGDCCVVLSPCAAQILVDYYATSNRPFTGHLYSLVGESAFSRPCYVVDNSNDWLKGQVSLYKWTSLPDSEREYLDKLKGAEKPGSHYWGKSYSDLSLSHFLGKRGFEVVEEDKG